MRLRSIDLHGYKSFAARTALQFDAPVTAIVGPNGSGKSNVMDALRWAIGAGSGRSLRTRRAEDVVFSGGRDRAPSGFAEVRIQLDNSDRWLDLEPAELEIVRRVHRDGQSEIRINGRAARLRDVQDLFRSSGLGSGGFALMSQGLVDEMLRLRPHERRQAIEEVGGVRQHRHQMEESRRRRQRAQEHLERARLLRDELAPRLRSLERAARRARRQIDLEGQLATAQRDYVRAAAAQLQTELIRRHDAAVSAAAASEAAEQRRQAATSALAEIERETSLARRAAESAAETLRSARSELRSLEHQQELDQQQRSWLSREMADLRSRLSNDRPNSPVVNLDDAKRKLADANTRLSAERSERTGRERALAKASAQHERALAEITNVRTKAGDLARRWKADAAYLQLSALDERVAECGLQAAQHGLALAEEAWGHAQREHATAVETAEQTEAQRAKIRRRLEEIESEISAIEQATERSETLRALVQEKIDDPILADAIFGELMDAALCDTLDEAIQRVRQIVVADAGRANAVVAASADELIEATMRSIDVVPDLESAKRIAQDGRAAITRDGIVVRPHGVVQAGGTQPEARRLRQQLSELKAERDQLQQLCNVLDEQTEADQLLEELAAALSQASEQVDIARGCVSESRDAGEAVRRERTLALSRRRSDQSEAARRRSQLEDAQRQKRLSERELASLPAIPDADLSELEQQRDRCAEMLADARARAAAATRARADRSRLFSLGRELETVETAIRDREPQLEAAAVAAADLDSHQAAKEHLEALRQRRAEATSELDQAQQARLLAERRDVEASAALREIESERTRLAAEAAAEGIEIGRVESPARATSDLHSENGSVHRNENGAASISVQAHTQSLTAIAVAEPSVSELRAAVLDIRDKMQRLGPVAPGAAQEFAAEQSRWRSMEEQIEDLEATESSLREAERELELLIERKFREACRQVDDAFKHYFQLMFRGGQAQLVMTEEHAHNEDESESQQDRPRLGVDIRAQPPGKRVSTLGLLSGGERALTAIALLFALLEVRPAPFCVLDEVDAALDEANVERFVAALKERAQQTQFVIITHNRRTIEQADSIYGVTMGAAGVSRLLSVRLDQLPHASP